MFCPKCKGEFRDGIDVCPLCEVELTNMCKEDEPEKAVPCLLCTVTNEFEAEVIIAKLRAEGVYAFKKFNGADGYNRILLGRTVLGVDIIVEEKDFEKALEIVDKSN